MYVCMYANNEKINTIPQKRYYKRVMLNSENCIALINLNITGLSGRINGVKL